MFNDFITHSLFTIAPTLNQLGHPSQHYQCQPKNVNIVINTISMKFPYNYYYSYNPIKPIPSFRSSPSLVSSSQAIRAMTPSPATGRRLDNGHAEAHRRHHGRARRRRRPRSRRRSPGDHLVTHGVTRGSHESEPPGWFTRSKVNNQKEREGT